LQRARATVLLVCCIEELKVGVVQKINTKNANPSPEDWLTKEKLLPSPENQFAVKSPWPA